MGFIKGDLPKRYRLIGTNRFSEFFREKNKPLSRKHKLLLRKMTPTRTIVVRDSMKAEPRSNYQQNIQTGTKNTKLNPSSVHFIVLFFGET